MSIQLLSLPHPLCWLDCLSGLKPWPLTLIPIFAASESSSPHEPWLSPGHLHFFGDLRTNAFPLGKPYWFVHSHIGSSTFEEQSWVGPGLGLLSAVVEGGRIAQSRRFGQLRCNYLSLGVRGAEQEETGKRGETELGWKGEMRRLPGPLAWVLDFLPLATQRAREWGLRTGVLRSPSEETPVRWRGFSPRPSLWWPCCLLCEILISLVCGPAHMVAECVIKGKAIPLPRQCFFLFLFLFFLTEKKK